MMAQKMMLVPVENYQEGASPSTTTTTTTTATATAGSQENIPRNRLDMEVIISAIPKNYKNRARALLNHITADPQQRLQWNARGELIFHGNVIHGSHITDLVKNSQRQYKHAQPTGLVEFQDGLKQLNIPMGLLETRPGPPGVRVAAEMTNQWINV